MNNYIQFYYDEDGYLTALIHKEGKSKVIRNQDRLNKLMDICERYGRSITGEITVRRSAEKITQKYDNYVKRIARLRILGEITENMKLSFKNVALNRKIAAIALAGTIAATGLSLTSGSAETETTKVDRASYETHMEMDDDLRVQPIEREFHGTSINPGATIVSIDDNDEEIDLIIEEEQTAEDQNEINQMLAADAFHFTYENRVGNESYQNAMRYEDLFERYANMYGVDKNLLIAIASQESAGDHVSHLEGGPAVGIMQIEKAPNLNTTIEVYNFELGHKEKIEITLDKLQDLEQNIKIGAALLRYNIVYSNYNIPIGLQTYNMGFGNMGKVIDACAEGKNIDNDELRNSQTNNAWLEYRNVVSSGDPQYLEHVFSYIPEGTSITIKDTEGNTYTVQLQNDYQATQEKTN